MLGECVRWYVGRGRRNACDGVSDTNAQRLQLANPWAPGQAILISLAQHVG